MLGYTYAISGQREAALNELQRLEQYYQDTLGRATEFFLIHSALGNTDKAFEWVDIACDNHEFSALVMLACAADTWFDNFKKDPRYDEALIRLGLKRYYP